MCCGFPACGLGADHHAARRQGQVRPRPRGRSSRRIGDRLGMAAMVADKAGLPRRKAQVSPALGAGPAVIFGPGGQAQAPGGGGGGTTVKRWASSVMSPAFSSRPDRRSRPAVAGQTAICRDHAAQRRPRKTGRWCSPFSASVPDFFGAGGGGGGAGVPQRVPPPKGPDSSPCCPSPCPCRPPCQRPSLPPAPEAGLRHRLGRVELHVFVQVTRDADRGALVQHLFHLFRQADVFDVEFWQRSGRSPRFSARWRC